MVTFLIFCDFLNILVVFVWNYIKILQKFLKSQKIENYSYFSELFVNVRKRFEFPKKL